MIMSSQDNASHEKMSSSSTAEAQSPIVGDRESSPAGSDAPSSFEEPPTGDERPLQFEYAVEKHSVTSEPGTTVSPSLDPLLRFREDNSRTLDEPVLTTAKEVTLSSSVGVGGSADVHDPFEAGERTLESGPAILTAAVASSVEEKKKHKNSDESDIALGEATVSLDDPISAPLLDLARGPCSLENHEKASTDRSRGSALDSSLPVHDTSPLKISPLRVFTQQPLLEDANNGISVPTPLYTKVRKPMIPAEIGARTDVLKAYDGEVCSASSIQQPATMETEMTGESCLSQQDPLIGVMPFQRQSQKETNTSIPVDKVAKKAFGAATEDVVFERPVDVHSITDTIIAAAACIAENPTWNNSLPSNSQHSGEVSTHQTPVFEADLSNAPEVFRVNRKRERNTAGNCPKRLHSYLIERYSAAPMMLFHLADDPPDDLTKETFENQVIHFPWKCPGRDAMSETPSVSTLLQFCYAMAAWQQSDPSSLTSVSSVRTRHSNSPVAIVSCANGKTRSAVAISCYLKFVGIVENVESGFCHFLARRCRSDFRFSSPEKVLSELPASLVTFFHNFDSAVELGDYLNRKPLLLKAIAIQGIPVENRPCIDIWDGTGSHVYSSHPGVWNDLSAKDGDDSVPQGQNIETSHRRGMSQWVEDEGFYRVNCLLQGDFCLLCRFGGPFAQDATDTTKILFRYANSTAFMESACPYELSCSQVDIQRRYADHFNEDEFLLSLLIDGFWNVEYAEDREMLSQDCPKEILPDVAFGVDAMEAGWRLIVSGHAVQPGDQDVDKLLSDSLGELDGCPRHIASLSLQLANFDSTMAQTILLEGRLRSWWHSHSDDYSLDQREKIPISDTILDSMEAINEDEALSQIDGLLTAVTSTCAASNAALLNRLPDESRTSCCANDGTLDKSDIGPTSTATDNANLDYMSPIMRPNPGDIMSTLNASRISSTFFRTNQSTFMGNHPLVPVVPRGRKSGGKLAPVEDPASDSAMNLLVKLDHPGIYLGDLLAASRKSRLVKAAATLGEAKGVVGKGSGEDAVASFGPSSLSTDMRIQNGGASEEGNASPLNASAAAIAAITNQTAMPREDESNTILSNVKPSAALATAIAERSGAIVGSISSSRKCGNWDATPINANPPAVLLPTLPKQEIKVEDTDATLGPLKLATALASAFAQRSLTATKPAALPEETNCKDFDAPAEKEKTLAALTSALASSSGPPPSAYDVMPLEDTDFPLKDDPKYQKYFKMRKMGLPDGAIRNAMQRDGVDASALELDPGKSLKSQMAIENNDADHFPLKDDPKYQKYFRMRRMGLPDGAIRNAMRRDGVEDSILEMDLERSLNSQTKVSMEPEEDGLPLKDDPAFQKYFKMQKMGLPDGAIRNAMERDGVDSSIIDLDPNKSLQSQQGSKPDENDVPLKDDPEWSKYFKMMKMGLPLAAVKNAVQRDGRDPSVLDLDHTKSLSSQGTNDGRMAPQRRKSKRVRRKKIFWNPLDSKQIKANSLWSHVKGRVQMHQLKYDEKEFDDLFTESADPADKKIAKQNKDARTKKSVQVIDGKRSMNGGIILARLKMEYEKIAEMVDQM